MTRGEMITVLQAEKVQYRNIRQGSGRLLTEDERGPWTDCDGEPGWNFYLTEYREKPKRFELWAVLGAGGYSGQYTTYGTQKKAELSNVPGVNIIHMVEAGSE